MVGRTHLQDATPLTLGQVISGWVGAARRRARRRSSARCRALLRAGARRHGGRHRPQRRIRGSARRSRGKIARGDRQAVRLGAEQVRRAVGARRDGQRQRRAAHAGRRADEDRQRRALVRLRSARGLRRADDPRERAGLVDHAGQDQPDAVRGADDGRRAGVRQRPRGGVRRLAGQLPAQRLQAGDPAQRARVDRSCWPTACRSFDERCARGHRAEREAHRASTSTTR